jgi:predicted O-linked N-acetylglucosamine transferase (SPINDLY family)
MGVPTVTLIGEAFFERMSYSNVTNAGLPELAAKDLAGYVDIAVKLAGDASRRAELRRTMRERIRGHPLGQPRVFVRDFMEAATRWMDEAP